MNSVKTKMSKRFRRTVRLAQLELLAEMQRSSTLSSAAKAAGVAQPAASRLLRTLADGTGVELFERFGRTLRPTPAGLVLLDRAARLVTDLDRIEDELHAVDQGLIGAASLGAGVASCYVLVPNAITRLLRDEAKISVRLREGAMGELTAKLREGRIDMFVGRLEPTNLQSDLSFEELYDPPMNIVCGVNHVLARRRKVGLPDALSREWLLPESGTPMRRAAEDLFRTARIWPTKSLIESSSIQANVVLLNSYDLLWVLSSDIASYFAKLGQLRALPLPIMRGPGPIVLVTLRDRKLSPAADQLRTCLKEAARSLGVTARAQKIGI